MGMFSWVTADTKESIANRYSSHENAGRPVFLLQPDGAAPIREADYEGHGEFGGVDAHEWLAEKNTGVKDRSLGMALESGRILQDMFGNIYRCAMHTSDAERELLSQVLVNSKELILFDNYASVIEVDGVTGTVNELTEQGVLKPVAINSLIQVRYPLKFSFDENAQYDALPASETCPHQGCFY